jgi:hypothetical protein
MIDRRRRLKDAESVLKPKPGRPKLHFVFKGGGDKGAFKFDFDDGGPVFVIPRPGERGMDEKAALKARLELLKARRAELLKGGGIE